MRTAGELLNEGWQRHQAGDLNAARRRYEAVAEQAPQNANAWCYLGILHFDLKDYAQSEVCYRRAVELQPEFPIAWSNLSNTLAALGREEEAIECCQRALRQQPDYVRAMNNLGAIHVKRGEFGEAAALLRRAVEANPHDTDAQRNLGAALIRHGSLSEAAEHSMAAVKMNPSDAEAHKNLGILRLVEGDWETGWEEYEWRFQAGDARLPQVPQPYWDGSPLEGRSILLAAEQGLGDTVQFVRFADVLKRQGAGRVVVHCQRPLLRLLEGLPGCDQLVANDQTPPATDVYAPLLSLPRLLAVHRDQDIPADVPYLIAEPERIERWRRRLDPDVFHVAIAWQGSRDYHADGQRSVPLRALAPLAETPGVQLVSLQKGDGIEQLAEFPDWQILDFGAELDADAPFVDTAAVISCVDLVVTADTSIVHVAGALAAPVWLAQCHSPDWRWLLDREDSPWYPTVRLFRQQQRGDWDGVYRRIADQLLPVVLRSGKGRCKTVRIDISPGELLDKLTILEIKRERIEDPEALENVRRELDLLTSQRRRSVLPLEGLDDLQRELKQVNERLWDIEDEVRNCERQGDFGDRFVELARSVYRENDRRAALKREINALLGSALREEKSYADY